MAIKLNFDEMDVVGVMPKKRPKSLFGMSTPTVRTYGRRPPEPSKAIPKTYDPQLGEVLDDFPSPPKGPVRPRVDIPDVPATTIPEVGNVDAVANKMRALMTPSGSATPGATGDGGYGGLLRKAYEGIGADTPPAPRPQGMGAWNLNALGRIIGDPVDRNRELLQEQALDMQAWKADRDQEDREIGRKLGVLRLMGSNLWRKDKFRNTGAAGRIAAEIAGLYADDFNNRWRNRHHFTKADLENKRAAYDATLRSTLLAQGLDADIARARVDRWKDYRNAFEKGELNKQEFEQKVKELMTKGEQDRGTESLKQHGDRQKETWKDKDREDKQLHESDILTEEGLQAQDKYDHEADQLYKKQQHETITKNREWVEDKKKRLHESNLQKKKFEGLTDLQKRKDDRAKLERKHETDLLDTKGDQAKKAADRAKKLAELKAKHDKEKTDRTKSLVELKGNQAVNKVKLDARRDYLNHLLKTNRITRKTHADEIKRLNQLGSEIFKARIHGAKKDKEIDDLRKKLEHKLDFEKEKAKLKSKADKDSLFDEGQKAVIKKLAGEGGKRYIKDTGEARDLSRSRRNLSQVITQGMGTVATYPVLATLGPKTRKFIIDDVKKYAGQADRQGTAAYNSVASFWNIIRTKTQEWLGDKGKIYKHVYNAHLAQGKSAAEAKKAAQTYRASAFKALEALEGSNIIAMTQVRTLFDLKGRTSKEDEMRAAMGFILGTDSNLKRSVKAMTAFHRQGEAISDYVGAVDNAPFLVKKLPMFKDMSDGNVARVKEDLNDFLDKGQLTAAAILKQDNYAKAARLDDFSNNQVKAYFSNLVKARKDWQRIKNKPGFSGKDIRSFIKRHMKVFKRGTIVPPPVKAPKRKTTAPTYGPKPLSKEEKEKMVNKLKAVKAPKRKTPAPPEEKEMWPVYPKRKPSYPYTWWGTVNPPKNRKPLTGGR